MNNTKRWLVATISIAAGLSACGGTNPAAKLQPEAPVATEASVTTVPVTTTPPTTEAPTTVPVTVAPTTTVKPECVNGATESRNLTPAGYDRWHCVSGKWAIDQHVITTTTTTVPVTPVDQAAVVANAAAQGVPADQCTAMLPTSLRGALGQGVRCAVVNADGSEGVWAFSVMPDMSIASPEYTETKAVPLARADCQQIVPEGQFQKGTAATVGTCLHFWARVFQFDANTGPCSFLGDYGSKRYSKKYDFSDAIIRVDGGDHCDLLGPVVEDTLVEVWAVSKGSESYSTQVGGSSTYAKFDLVDIVAYG